MGSRQSEEQERPAREACAVATEALQLVRQSHEHIARTTMQFAQICDTVGRTCDGATSEDLAYIVYGLQRLWDRYRSLERESEIDLREALEAQYRAEAGLDSPQCRIRGSR